MQYKIEGAPLPVVICQMDRARLSSQKKEA